MLIKIHFSYACELAQMSTLQNGMIICNFIFTYKTETNWIRSWVQLCDASASSSSCSTHAKSGWAKPLLPYIQPKQQITECPSNPMHQGMCHCHRAPTNQSPCSHHHHSCSSASCTSPHDPAFSICNFGQSFWICGFISEYGIQEAGKTNHHSNLSVFPSNTLFYPYPPTAPHPFPVLASSWPPGMG